MIKINGKTLSTLTCIGGAVSLGGLITYLCVDSSKKSKAAREEREKKYQYERKGILATLDANPIPEDIDISNATFANKAFTGEEKAAARKVIKYYIDIAECAAKSIKNSKDTIEIQNRLLDKYLDNVNQAKNIIADFTNPNFSADIIKSVLVYQSSVLADITKAAEEAQSRKDEMDRLDREYQMEKLRLDREAAAEQQKLEALAVAAKAMSSNVNVQVGDANVTKEES